MSPFDPTYYHGDQIGSTRALSDDVPAVAEVVYTAFGEIVYQDASVGTRYRYAGEHGYECFDDLDWGEFGGVDFEETTKRGTTKRGRNETKRGRNEGRRNEGQSPIFLPACG